MVRAYRHVYAVHMARLSFAGLASLDGYINDARGDFDWAMPSPEVHQFANDLDSAVGTHVYGRKLYETMAVWETMPPGDPIMDEYAEVWRAADKVVFSRRLPDVPTARTTLIREFSLDFLSDLKATATRDIAIGGPTLAAHAFSLIDDIHLFINPVIIGGGTRMLPDGVTAELTLADSRVFDNGVVYVHYRKDA